MTKNMLFAGLLGFVVILSAPSLSTHAQVTSNHIAKMKTVTGSTITEDGRYIAYTIAIPADPKKENSYSQNHLYVLNTGNNTETPFYTSGSVSQVQFRPGINSITFIARKDGEKQNAIYEMSLNGGEANKLFSFTSNISAYSWSPDGQKVIFSTLEKEYKPKTSLTYAPKFYEEEFSDRNAYLVNMIGGNQTPLKMNAKGAVYQMVWSPNGQKIALTVAPTSSVDDSYMEQKIQIFDVNNRNQIANISNLGKLGQIEWSPNGQSIAIVGAYDLNDPTSGSLFIADATGGSPKVLHADYLGKFESIIWKEDKFIHFHSSEGVASTLGTIQPDGNNFKYILKSNELNVTSFSLAKNGTISYTANTPMHPTEVFTLANNKKATPVRRTNSNSWLNNLKLGKQELITYKARDNKYDIQGLLIYPLNYKEGTALPLITVVHGGPESHYSNGWLTAYSMPGQMAAAKGYAVFYPNYRGSTGRGTDFTYSSQGDLGGKEFDDVVDGVDYLIAKGLADKNRIGVTGGSYGGYASAWMSTYYSDRFAAAVMFVGISNNISKFGTSDIPNEMFLVHARKRVWDDWKWQLERSPIYYADRAQTPILIMHGSEDPRVHPAQSMELYRHIKVRKPEVPLRLIYYPGEGHGNARSGSRFDYNQRMMQWFETYLKTGNAKAEKPNLDLPE